MTTFPQPISQALNPRRSSALGSALLIIGIIVALAAAIYGFIEGRRTEPVVIALRSVPAGQQLVAEDLGVIELPLHRPAQLNGVADPNVLVGQWATGSIRPDDLLRAELVRDTPPDLPFYPNGRALGSDMVPFAFTLAGIGPITDRDRINIGFSADDPALCPGSTARGAFACRLLTRIPVLYIADEIAYLELTTYQAQALRAIQAAGVQLWGERYGAASAAIPALDRLDATALDAALLQQPAGER